MEHLLNNCIFTSRLWDTFATIFQQTDRDRGSIINTLNNWRRNFSDYEFLGLAWALTPSFIIWNVWKERNNKIFKNEKRPSQHLFEHILKQLKETDYWHPPPQGFLKYNIDGASKGNPGTVGFGGALRDENESILFIFHCHLGRATNNMAELMALEQCLDFLEQDNRQNVIIEANSELIINSVKRISCGTEPKKVSKHWRLIQVFQRIQLHLLCLRTVSFNHVRRTANKLADILAN
eukprot:PITA_10632